MSETQSKTTTLLLSSFLPLLLLSVDLFTLFLQPHSKAISHLSLGVILAQLLCILVFNKGEICNGQRARLIKANNYLIIYWVLWLLLSLFSTYHYALTDIVSLSGIAVSLAILFQPQDPQMRKSILILGALLGGLGIFCYLLIFIELPILFIVQYNPIGQLLAALILAHLLLVISRNRLQGFIALLPLAMLLSLLLNAALLLGILIYAHLHTLTLANHFSFGLYFALHLIISFLIGLHIFKKWKFSYNTLIILFFIAITLPVWGTFGYAYPL